MNDFLQAWNASPLSPNWEMGMPEGLTNAFSLFFLKNQLLVGGEFQAPVIIYFRILNIFELPAVKISSRMALKIIDYGTKEYDQMVKLRNDMLRKPLGLHFTKEELEKEKTDVLMGAFEDGRILGCCLLTRIDDHSVRLRQMAVPNNLQGKGMGRALMIFAENIARDMGYRTLVMHARKTAVGFYEKMGYIAKGKEFEEVTIPHFVMEKIL
jgi:predicted GNAT family N-acyltransferase